MAQYGVALGPSCEACPAQHRDVPVGQPPAMCAPPESNTQLASAVAAALGDRRLVYVGIRGGDAEALAALPNLSHVISLSDTFDQRNDVLSGSIEDLTKQRVDLDGNFEIGVGGQTWFLNAVEFATSEPSVLLSYRPSDLTSLAVLRSGSNCTYLGISDRLQAKFEHKPSVDDALQAIGVPTLGWNAVRRLDIDAVQSALDHTAAVVRLPFSSGGAGLALIETVDDYAEILLDDICGRGCHRSVRRCSSFERRGRSVAGRDHGPPPVGAADRNRGPYEPAVWLLWE